jgi:mannose-6-phosphate isomerase-like protein (cupin superfamily)
MQLAQLRFRNSFAVKAGNSRSQAAIMVLPAGKSEGGPDNRHQGSDQWLYVVSGEGVVVVEGEQSPLSPGTLILIERGETHEVRNTGSQPLETLSFYVPPAYTEEGDALPAGKG